MTSRVPRSYEYPRDVWAKFKPGDPCPCCDTILVEALRMQDADPVTALCLGCAKAGLEEMLASDA